MKCSDAVSLHLKTSAKINKLANVLFFVYIKVTWPGVILPPLVMSYYKYYTTDMGLDAFHLPFYMWYELVRFSPIL